MLRKASHVVLTVMIALAAGCASSAQNNANRTAAEPFKLGTFEIGGAERVGLVLRDSLVVELNAANRELESGPNVTKVTMPADMKELIRRWDSGMSRRAYEIVNSLVSGNRLQAASRPAYVYDVAKVRAVAPIKYPTKMLNAATNYYGHVGEQASPEEQKKAADERRRDRGAPYLFLKATEGAIIGNGDDIILPAGRDRIDWECEIGIVIGRPAKRVPAAKANDYIFGYTIQLDMSDRGGRPEAQPKFGNSDWFLGKSHDTFAPMGPFIVPKEFVKDPMKMTQKLWVNGTLMQDGGATDMIHNINELIEYGSMVMTLYPGDVIAAGSPAGTGMSRSVRPEQIFLKAGDKIVATIDAIGTLTHTVKAESR
jgi:2-keto-4-pentenoate hydratase/2-oxohepta-3-ene-1,7-dioic acid hydratase in catechol pathway